MKQHILVLTLSSFFLLSCGGGQGGTTSSQATSHADTLSATTTEVLSSSSEATSSSEAASSSQKEFITVEFDEAEDYVSDGIQTAFGDINVGRPLITELNYNFSFSYTNGLATTGSTMTVTDNGVCILDRISENGDSFYLKGVKEGETILRVYDKDGYLRYRNKITFRNAFESDEVLNFAFEEVDHYESNFFKGAYITFVGPNDLIFSGKDETTTLEYPIDFNIEYTHSDNTWHYYNVINWNNRNQAGDLTLNLVQIAIDQTGYWLHAYTRSSFLDWFTPVF